MPDLSLLFIKNNAQLKLSFIKKRRPIETSPFLFFTTPLKYCLIKALTVKRNCVTIISDCV